VNLPLGEDRSINISPQVLNHWATVGLTLVLAFMTWQWQQQVAATDELRRDLRAGRDARIALEAEVKAHEVSDERTEVEVRAIGQKQVDVLSRLSVIETATTEIERRLMAIEEKLGEPNGRH